MMFKVCRNALILKSNKESTYTHEEIKKHSIYRHRAAIMRNSRTKLLRLFSKKNNRRQLNFISQGQFLGTFFSLMLINHWGRFYTGATSCSISPRGNRAIGSSVRSAPCQRAHHMTPPLQAGVLLIRQ